MAKILITGVSGLVGQELAKRLSAWHEVIGYGRKKSEKFGLKVFHWDYAKRALEKEAIVNVDVLVHLAGAGVMDKRWTMDYKKEIIESRVNSLQFLFDEFKSQKRFPKVLVCAGGVGYYGTADLQKPATEQSPAGTDFLAQVCIEWERVAKQFEKEGCRVVIVRTAVVLSSQGGALQALLKINSLRISNVTGSGRQFFSWIHINDLCSFFVRAIENDTVKGAYNLVAPQLVSSKEFDRTLQRISGKKALFPGAPGFILKLVLGERAVTLLKGVPVQPEKLLTEKFEFDFPNLESALRDLLAKKLH